MLGFSANGHSLIEWLDVRLVEKHVTAVEMARINLPIFLGFFIGLLPPTRSFQGKFDCSISPESSIAVFTILSRCISA